MRKYVVFFLLMIAVGCAGVPAFQRPLCESECEKCSSHETCVGLCSQLASGFNREECVNPSQSLWDCAVVEGCHFPMECSDEIGSFLECTMR